jgi:hypothetical protein
MTSLNDNTLALKGHYPSQPTPTFRKAEEDDHAITPGLLISAAFFVSCT